MCLSSGNRSTYLIVVRKKENVILIFGHGKGKSTVLYLHFF